MNSPRLLRVALTFAATLFATSYAAIAAANEVCCAPEPVVVEPAQPSWIFAASTYTHDPETGARVGQYMRKPPVEPLPDPRDVTSGYRRTQTIIRGTGGSSDTSYQVQSWGNGRGGLDAEWERFHDAWKESYLTGGNYNQSPGNIGYGPGWGRGPQWGWGNQGWGGGPNGPMGPPQGGGPWQGGPGGPGGWNGGGWNNNGGGNWNNGGGNWNHNGGNWQGGPPQNGGPQNGGPYGNQGG